MKRTRSRGGVTLTELIVVMGISTALGAVLFPVFSSVRASRRTTVCLHNLQQIGVGAQMYYDDQGGPPMQPLPISLCSYLRDSAAFICPNDRDSDDSYSAFFVGRRGESGTHEFIVGCPRHRGSVKSVGVWGQVECGTDPSGPMRYEPKHGETQEIIAGDTVEGGTVHFDDGSEMVVAKGHAVVLTSARREGILHTVVWLPEDEKKGRIDVDVTPGSVFEVVTPTAIASVMGTRFTVEIKAKRVRGVNCSCTEVSVREGTVVVEGRLSPCRRVLKAGGRTLVESFAIADRPGQGSGPWTDPWEGVGSKWWR